MRNVVIFLYVWLMALTLVLSILVIQGDRNRAQNRAQVCAKFATLSATFTDLIRKGEKELPSLAYYRAHPAELRQVVAQDEQTITQLTAALTCN